MEPVPETERMEEFRSSPIPELRLHQPAPILTSTADLTKKSHYLRRSTEPTSPNSPTWSSGAPLPYRPRTASPLSGAHTRSKSAVIPSLPGIGRTRSMPGVDGAGRILSPPLVRPSSPSGSGSPSRQRLPRKPADESFPTSPVRSSVLDSDRKPQPPDRSVSPSFGLPPTPATGMPRRTSSPLRYATLPTSSSSPSLPATPSSVASSPSYRFEGSSSGYNFPAYAPPSSMPSTPSSMRSRSPSISSLETIPDTPDAEEAAIEADRISQLKADADAAEGNDSSGDPKGRGSLDMPTRGRTLGGMGSRDKRKRWSVCGAERRGDLDLETIWED